MRASIVTQAAAQSCQVLIKPGQNDRQVLKLILYLSVNCMLFDELIPEQHKIRGRTNEVRRTQDAG